MTESTWAGAKSIGGSQGLRRRRPNPLRGGGNRLWEGPDQLRRRSWFHRGAGKQLHGRKIQSVPRTDDFGAARINFGDRTDNEVMGVDYKVRRPIHFGAGKSNRRGDQSTPALGNRISRDEGTTRRGGENRRGTEWKTRVRGVIERAGLRPGASSGRDSALRQRQILLGYASILPIATGEGRRRTD